MIDVTKQRIIIHVSTSEMPTVKRMARLAEIGGKSNIRDDKDRKASLYRDQLSGQLGTFAFHRYWFGDTRKWRDDRWHQNQFQYAGDGGHDVAACNIDVKGSWVYTDGKKELCDYHLAVRPHEMHKDWIYILALAEVSPAHDQAMVHLMGWAHTTMFPSETETQGKFAGAYTILAKELYPLPPIDWDWFSNIDNKSK